MLRSVVMGTDAGTMTWSLGWLLRRAREDAGLSQLQLADAVRVSRAQISKWERDRDVPDLVEFERVLDATRAPWLREAAQEAAARSRCYARRSYEHGACHPLAMHQIATQSGGSVLVRAIV